MTTSLLPAPIFPWRLLVVSVVGLLCVACSSLPRVPEAELVAFSGEARRCHAFLHAMDREVQQAEVTDAEYHRISGFPYLRSSRTLAALTPASSGAADFLAWAEQLRGLDEEARLIEYANLPATVRARLDAQGPQGQSVRTYLRQCGLRLLESDLKSAPRRAALASAAVVPDEYRSLRRVLGLYPLTMFPVATGISRWQQETQATYATPLEALAVTGRLVRYQAPQHDQRLTAAAIAGHLRRWQQQHPLGLPVPDEGSREALFASFSPVWEIDVAHHDDRIGRPYWHTDGSLRLQVLDPVVYRRLSYTRLGGQWLLQLNYVLWFPARTQTGVFDLYGGHLDGLIWRVTLGPDGAPWLYDAIHPCGCYHMLFPSRHLTYKAAQADEFLEPTLIPQAAPPWRPDTPLRIRVAHQTHFIERITQDLETHPFRGEQVRYRWGDYLELRSLPHPEGRRSLFDGEGIVPGTERAERWLLWPMGIPNVGAMRQWGHHAIALLGRRHFDEVELFGRWFTLKKGS